MGGTCIRKVEGRKFENSLFREKLSEPENYATAQLLMRDELNINGEEQVKL